MKDEERQRAMETSIEDLRRLIEKNETRFGNREFKPASFDDAVQQLNHLVAKSKRKLDGFDSTS